MASNHKSISRRSFNSKSASYRHNWDIFESWCISHELCPLPATPEVVALFSNEYANTKKLRYKQLKPFISSIRHFHLIANMASPCDSKIMMDTREYFKERSERKTNIQSRGINRKQSDSTKSCYQRCWSNFSSWCLEHGQSPLPASVKTLKSYLLELMEIKNQAPKTIQLKLGAIRDMHIKNGLSHEIGNHQIKSLITKHKNMHSSPKTRKNILYYSEVQTIVDAIDTGNLRGIRDKAIVLLMCHGALSGNAIRKIKLCDLRIVGVKHRGGHRLPNANMKLHVLNETIIYSEKCGSYCAVNAIINWINSADISSGFLFRQLHRDHYVSSESCLVESSIHLSLIHI